MSDIISAIHDDMNEYEDLCRRFGEEVVRKWVGYQHLPDCYSEHAKILVKRAHDEYAAKSAAQRTA